MSDDGTRNRQGRTGQEGQAEVQQEALTSLPPVPVEACQICNTTHTDGVTRQHKFTPPGVPIDTRQFDRRRPGRRVTSDDTSRRVPSAQGAAERGVLRPVASPFDPVLRMALIDAGVITVEQLRAAEEKIRVFTQQVTETGPVYRGGENANE